MHTIISPMTSNSSISTTDPAPGERLQPVTITVNGEVRAIPHDTTVQGLLVLLGLEPRKIAVERNMEIVPKSLYEETRLGADDRIEIVQFVGGG